MRQASSVPNRSRNAASLRPLSARRKPDAITIRPLCFSSKTFKTLPPELQQAVVKAGKEAGAHGREIESSEDSAKLEALEKAGKLKRVAFKERAEMKKLVDPVMAAYAKEIGADKIYEQINATS